MKQLPFIFTSILWIFLWKNTTLHYHGDYPLSNTFYIAGQNYVLEGFKYFGLAVYSFGGLPYTHLPPGPEWIQGLIAVLQRTVFSWVEFNLFHSLVTAVISILMIEKIIRETFKQVEIIFGKIGDEHVRLQWIRMILFSSSIAQVFLGNAYWLGNLLSITLMLVIGSQVAFDLKNELKIKTKTFILSMISFGIAYWMGLSTISLNGLYFCILIYFCSPNKNIINNFLKFCSSAFVVAVIMVFLKLWQNKAYLGSWQAVYDDATQIVKIRTGQNEAYSYHFINHLMKILYRGVYLFGIVPLVLFIWMRIKKIKLANKEVQFLFAIFIASVSWQGVMREHAYAHIYLLNHAIVFFAFLSELTLRALQSKFVNGKNRTNAIVVLSSYFQWILLWGVALIPAIR